MSTATAQQRAVASLPASVMSALSVWLQGVYPILTLPEDEVAA
jgi:hypothetical protein